MPGFDQTGPTGNGPQTGGRRGPCAAENNAPNRQRGFGRQLKTNSENPQGTGENWRPNGGNGRRPRCGGGQRQRFRGGQY